MLKLIAAVVQIIGQNCLHSIKQCTVYCTGIIAAAVKHGVPRYIPPNEIVQGSPAVNQNLVDVLESGCFSPP